MTAPNTAEKVCRGMPSQSAQVPSSRVSSIKPSPTSNQTARIGDISRYVLPARSQFRAASCSSRPLEASSSSLPFGQFVDQFVVVGGEDHVVDLDGSVVGVVGDSG